MTGRGDRPDEVMAQIAAEVTDALTPFFEGVMAAASSVYDQLGGAEGIAAMRAEIDAWEAAHPDVRYGQPCRCICHPHHAGAICTGDAETIDVVIAWGEPMALYVCTPCAEARHP